MTFTTGNKNIVLLVNPINKSVFVGNPARPIAGLVELECFGFPNPLIWSSNYTVCFSRFLIAMFTRLTYSSRLSFLFSPKSETAEIEISSSCSLLKRAFILFKKSGVSSLDRIRITVSIIFSFIPTKIYNSIENTLTMNSADFT